MENGWTTAQTTKLVRLWSQGVSAKQIADHLGDKTRSAAIGKAKRLGLSKTAAIRFMPSSRIGQAQFRKDVLSAYGGKCAMTGGRQIEVLEACHIVPHSVNQNNDLTNALCLRSDIHSLFDCGLLSVSQRFTILLAPTVTDSDYQQLHNAPLSMPISAFDKPLPNNFAWHRENVFKPQRR